MPAVKYLFTLSNAQGYEGLEEELKLSAEMDIPDGYNDNELKHIINEIQAELPYFQYQNVIVEVNEVQVQEKAVSSFEVKGDNIGKEQKKYIKRVYEKIAQDVRITRSNTPLNNPEDKIRYEKVFDGVKNTLSNLMEILFGWLNRFKTKQQKELLRKERMEKQRLEEEKQRLEDEKTFIATELLIEREIIQKELIEKEIQLEKQKIIRMKVEERLEKTKLARLKKEADTQKLKTEFIKVDSRNKELETKNKELETKYKEFETENKELKTQIAEYDVKLKQSEVKLKQSKANTKAVREHLKAAFNLYQDGGIENGGFER